VKTKLMLEVDYDPKRTDPEGLARALDRLLETALSVTGSLDEYGNPKFGEFLTMEEPTSSVRYALYDLAADELFATHVFGYSDRAAMVAANFDNLIVVPLAIPPRGASRN
jgi:hypothetical protein